MVLSNQGHNMKNTIKPTTEKVALIVMRAQTLHNGHINLIFKAMVENDVVIVGLGSRNQEISFSNPFPVSKRINMLKKVFGDSSKIKIITLADINACSFEEWSEYVYSEIETLKMPQPNRYYAGEEANSQWFGSVNSFTGVAPEIILVDRLKSKIMSATQIRQSISSGSNSWKEHVPACLHQYILDNFPTQFTLTEMIKHNSTLKF
jgi:cytidyltransferase-like protein